MGQRHEWKVEYPTNRLLEAAIRKAEYHEQRVEHYEAEVKKAQTELKERGINWQQPFNASTQTSVMQMAPTLDQDLVREVNRLQQKMEQHKRERDEYRRWGCLLNIAGEDNAIGTLLIDEDDVEYFGLTEE